MGGGNKLRGRDQFKRYKRILFFMAKVVSFLPKKKREVIYILCRNIHGNIGIALRYIILKTLAKSCGDNVAVMEGVYLKNISQIEFANNISIHPMTYIEGAGKIRIGNNVSIANAVSIISTEHKFGDINTPIKDQGSIYNPIVIEDDVWIGTRVVILAGSNIKTGSVIGAGAVVTKQTEEYSVNVGVPAIKIKSRIT